MRNEDNKMRKNNYERFILLFGTLVALTILLIFSGCNDEDMEPGDGLPNLTGKSMTYSLVTTNGSGVSGNVIFAETTTGTTLITITLSGSSASASHPVHIHENSMVAGGPIAISLGSVDGSSGTLVVEVSETDGGAMLTYDDLVVFDGHLNIHESAQNLSNLIARADIGGNEFTGESEDFDLYGILNSEVKGEATIYERKNGKTLLTILLENDDTNESHPTHIHANTAAEGGPIVLSLNPVDAATGISLTDITELDDGTMVSFSDLKDLDGYINVHLSSSSLSTLVVQGDFGQNKLTGDEEVYNLLENSGSGVSGTVTFSERKNGETLISISLSGTNQGNMHPTHIHQNSTSEGGGILLDLNDVIGDTGVSRTQVVTLNDGTPITYDNLITLNGHINVHLSSESLSTILSRGNIGANVQ